MIPASMVNILGFFSKKRAKVLHQKPRWPCFPQLQVKPLCFESRKPRSSTERTESGRRMNPPAQQVQACSSTLPQPPHPCAPLSLRGERGCGGEGDPDASASGPCSPWPFRAFCDSTPTSCLAPCTSFSSAAQCAASQLLDLAGLLFDLLVLLQAHLIERLDGDQSDPDRVGDVNMAIATTQAESRAKILSCRADMPNRSILALKIPFRDGEKTQPLENALFVHQPPVWAIRRSNSANNSKAGATGSPSDPGLAPTLRYFALS
jgi:hypothetical protein